MRYGPFELDGTEADQGLLIAALKRGDYPWECIVPGVQAKAGRDYVPVKFSDLSRYMHGGDAHDHSGAYDLLEARHRVLGLFWLDFRIEIDQSLKDEPELCAEVLWSEGAHLIDYAVMTDADREAVWDAFHGGADDIGGHDHGWWEKADYGAEYRSLVGEAMMAAIVQAYTDIEPTILLTHNATEEVGRKVRAILTPELVEDSFVGCRLSKVFHRRGAHWYSCVHTSWPTRELAIAAGRRPCSKCKP